MQKTRHQQRHRDANRQPRRAAAIGAVHLHVLPSQEGAAEQTRARRTPTSKRSHPFGRGPLHRLHTGRLRPRADDSEMTPAGRETLRLRPGHECPVVRATALPRRRACRRNHGASTAGATDVNASKSQFRHVEQRLPLRRIAVASSASTCGGTLWNSTRRPRVSRKIWCMPDTFIGGSTGVTPTVRTGTNSRGLVDTRTTGRQACADPQRSPPVGRAVPLGPAQIGRAAAQIRPRGRRRRFDSRGT